MRAEVISKVLKRQPFTPFRIHLTDGKIYDVRHPEMVFLGRDTVIVGTEQTNESVPVFEEFELVSLLHVTRIEPVAAPA